VKGKPSTAKYDSLGNVEEVVERLNAKSASHKKKMIHIYLIASHLIN
jgi:hypothetical protein